MKRERIVEIHFYEWSVSRWRASEARATLSLPAREIYRECLDLCYTTGSIPKDHAALAGLCGCSEVEIDEIFPQIERYFYTLRTDKNRLANTFADMFRREFFGYKRKQSTYGARGGRPKVHENNELKRVPFSDQKAKLSEAKLSEAKTKTSEAKRRVPFSETVPGTEEESPPQISQPLRPLKPDQIEQMRHWMQEAAGPAGEQLGLPDGKLAESVLRACGDMEAAQAWLLRLHQARKFPRQNYAFYLRLAGDEFLNGSSR